MGLEIQNVRQSIGVSISTGATGLSAAVDLAGYRVAAIDMSTAWTAAVLTFQGASSSDATYQDLYDVNGNELTVQSTASRNICVDSPTALALQAHRWLKIRSGTSASAIAQAAARTLTLVVIP